VNYADGFARPNHNIGIITGAISGFFALDIDGEEGFATVRSQGDWPLTVETESREWRRQLWFTLPAHTVTNSCRKYRDANGEKITLPGLDIRGDGGYVQAPCSLHHSGSRYRWIHHPDDVAMAAAPSWLLAYTVKREIEPQVFRMTRPVVDGEKRYAWKVLERRCAVLAGLVDGKHAELLKAATHLGGYVPCGALLESDIEENLFNAVAPRALDLNRARETIRHGIAYGKDRPLMIERM
jgi:hypothetical protein